MTNQSVVRKFGKSPAGLFEGGALTKADEIRNKLQNACHARLFSKHIMIDEGCVFDTLKNSEDNFGKWEKRNFECISLYDKSNLKGMVHEKLMVNSESLAPAEDFIKKHCSRLIIFLNGTLYALTQTKDLSESELQSAMAKINSVQRTVDRPIARPNKLMTQEQLMALIDAVISPRKGETILLLGDYNKDCSQDTGRLDRYELLRRWHEAAVALGKEKGFSVLPIAKYLETGNHGAPLPEVAIADGKGVNLLETILKASIVISMPSFSATGPLNMIAQDKNIHAENRIRVVSMPGVAVDMEKAMSADYSEISRRGRALKEIVRKAAGFKVEFSGKGVPEVTSLYVDTRAGHEWEVDDGMCHTKGSLINFPSGEVFVAPYEGADPAEIAKLGNSQTKGTWVTYSPEDDKLVFLKVENNRIVDVQGDSIKADAIRKAIKAHPDNANIAELAFGINELANGMSKRILEQEKAGPHIAYGYDGHLGGKVMPGPDGLGHIDEVYTPLTAVKVLITAVYPDGSERLIAENGKVTAV